MIKEILSSVWFTFCLNVALCAAVFFIGYFQTKKLNKKSKENSSYQLRAYVPTIWTSLGILGTFISILFSLIVWAISGEDNINGLIYNIAPAFITSIIGIIGSIITSIKNKQYLASVECKEKDAFEQHQYENNISRGSSFSPEVILLEILKEIKNSREKSIDENAELIKKLNSLNTERNNITGKFQERLEGKLDDILTRISTESGETRNTISYALTKQQNDFEKAVGNIKTAFNDALSDLKTNFETTTNNLKNNFTETLEKQNNIIKEKLGDLNSSLGTKIDTYNATCESLITRLIDTTKEILVNDSKQRNEELKGFIGKEDEKITSFIKEQTLLYEGINGNMDALVSDIRKLFEEDIKHSIEQFAEHEHNVSIETITLCNNKLIADASDYLNNHMSAISVYLANLDNQTKTTYESFKETVNGIAQTIASKLQELYDQQTSLIGGTIDNNRNQIESALSTNGKSIQTILNANKEAIESVSNEIKADNSSIKNELAAAQQRWKEASEKIEADHLGKVVEIHTHTETEILDIQNRIISIGNKLQEKLDNIEKEVTRSISEFENKLNEVKEDSVGQSEKTIKELNAQIQKALQVEALQNASVKLSTNIGETLGRFDENTSKINQNLQAVAKSINDSSDKYAATIQEYDDKLGYIETTLNTMKQHITSVSVLEGVLKDVNEAVLRVEKMRDDVKRDTSMSSDSHKSSRVKKQES